MPIFVILLYIRGFVIYIYIYIRSFVNIRDFVIHSWFCYLYIYIYIYIYSVLLIFVVLLFINIYS